MGRRRYSFDKTLQEAHDSEGLFAHSQIVQSRGLPRCSCSAKGLTFATQSESQIFCGDGCDVLEGDLEIPKIRERDNERLGANPLFPTTIDGLLNGRSGIRNARM